MSSRPIRTPECRESGERSTLPAPSAAALLAGVGLALILVPGAAVAQEAVQPPLQPTSVATTGTVALPEISVVATRTPRPIAEIGSALTIITEEQIEERQTRILSDILRDVPGVAVSRTGPAGAVTQVRIRGAEGNQTLVLIDGVEVNDPADGREFNFANLLALDVERVEILRGPQSALYGSEAIGGVINIITRRGRGPVTGRAFFEGGSFSTFAGSVGVSGGGETYGFAGTASFFRSGGIDVSGSQGEEDDFTNLTVNLTGHIEPVDFLRLDFAARAVDSSRSLDDQEFTFGTTVDSTISESDDVQLSGLAQATLTLFDGAWEQIVGASALSTDNETNGAFGPSESEATLADLNYQSNVYLETPDLADAEHVLTFFVEREATDFSNSAGADNNTVDLAYVGQYQLSVLDRLFLSGSVRHDAFDGLDDFTTYRVTAAYLFEEFGTRLHGSYGTGVQRPSPTEQFGFVPGTFVGNPDLLPEESKGWDIGVEQSLFDDRLVVDVTYFNADLENEITSLFDDGVSLFTVDNLDGESTREGVEVTISASPLDNLDISASYTYLDAEEPNGDEEVRRAPHIASVNATYRFLDDRARVNLGVRFNGAQEDLEFGSATPAERVELDSFTLVNISGSYRLSDNVEIFGRVENVLDEDYEEVFQFDAPGIGAFAGVRLNL